MSHACMPGSGEAEGIPAVYIQPQHLQLCEYTAALLPDKVQARLRLLYHFAAKLNSRHVCNLQG